MKQWTILFEFTLNNNLSFTTKRKKNLRFVSVYCQVLLSNTAYLFFFLSFSFLFECIHFLSLLFTLSFDVLLLFFSIFLSLSFFLFIHHCLNWIMTSFFHFPIETEEKWNLSHLSTYLIESRRKKNSLF